MLFILIISFMNLHYFKNYKNSNFNLRSDKNEIINILQKNKDQLINKNFLDAIEK